MSFCGAAMLCCVFQPLYAQTPAPKPSPSPAAKPSPAPKPTPKPSPSPSGPQQGTREYTEAALQRLKEVRSEYDRLCWSNAPTLEELERAQVAVMVANTNLTVATVWETAPRPQIREQRELKDYLWRRASELAHDKKDYEAEFKAYHEFEKAEEKLLDLEAAARGAIYAVIDPGNFIRDAAQQCLPHRDLLKAKNDAALAALEKEKAEEEKAQKEKQAQKTATGGAKPADECKKGVGATGAMERLACQESR
jgi:hypothetical protein